MDFEKLAQAAGYVLERHEGHIDKKRLAETLYLADRKAMERTGYSVTGDAYVCAKGRPVLEGLMRLLENRFHDSSMQTRWNSLFRTAGENICLAVPYVSDGKLSDMEILVLDESNEIEDMDYPECKGLQDGALLEKKRILEALGFTEKEIEDIEEEKEAYRKEAEILESLKSSASDSLS